MKQFTNQFSLSKTLRFELRPVGATQQNIDEQGILKQDEELAQSYKIVKKIIDRYHKAFIDDTMSHCSLTKDEAGNELSWLEKVQEYYTKREHTEEEEKAFTDAMDTLRKIVNDSFSKKNRERYARLFSKDLVKEDLFTTSLSDYKISDEEKLTISKFQNFTTYFSGFHENRKNMYSSEAKACTIGYRLIDENLPRFISNLSIFQKVNETAIAEYFADIEHDMEEMLQGTRVEEVFSLPYYNNLLQQKYIDLFNTVIGAVVSEDKHVKGLNQYINEYNQKQTERSARLPKFKPLYKQILSDRVQTSFKIESFDNSQDVLDAIVQFYRNLQNILTNEENNLPKLLENLTDFDLSGIYYSTKNLSNLSQHVFNNWGAIDYAWMEDLRRNNPRKKNETDEKYANRINAISKKTESISLGRIIEDLTAYQKNPKEDIINYFVNAGESKSNGSIFATIEDAYERAKDLLNTDYPKDKNLLADEKSIGLIKDLLDAIKDLQQFVKPLLGNGKEPDKDEKFYGEFSSYWEILNEFTPLYNMVRNYVTRKPYSIEKFKLNFNNSQLLNGWDVNKEQDCSGALLRKDGLYYLAIRRKTCKKGFSESEVNAEGECYEKIDYKLLPGANKMLPKVFFSKKRIDDFAPSEAILAIKEKGSFKKGSGFCKNDLHALIDFYKGAIEKHEDWRKFGFHFSPTSSYEDISGFYREVEDQGYQLKFRKVSKAYIDSLVDAGDIFLFQIYNKDFSTYSKGNPNLHTLYWKMLFDERNLKDVVYKLNGEAEVFFRKASIVTKSPTHPANQAIENKNKSNTKRESIFSYDLIKDKRFHYNKFQFHVPITMNFKASAGEAGMNERVQDYIRQSDDLHIIGIDRGERHLLYLSVIDLKGNIVEQKTLNVIKNSYNGNEYETNYHDLLDSRDAERLNARRDWKTIEGIKELKQGYLSQVVHQITSLMLKYNAIVVLEDLNKGFMRGRQKVESSVYQQFEHSLIDKLCYLASKTADANVEGGLLKAYQLATPYNTKMGHQNGFVFFIPAWNTSKIDPVTGFTNLFDLHIDTMKGIKDFFEKFDAIRWNEDREWFEFDFDYNNFTTKAEGSRTLWTLCSQGKRILTFRNPEKNSEWDNKEIDLTEEMKELFESKNIDITKDVKSQILEQTELKFFTGLRDLFRLLLQMRNSVTNTEVDYLISPVADDKGHFYNSNEVTDNSLPNNADANGAYNIARKGLWLVRQIKQTHPGDKIDFAITNKEWLQFAQDKPYLK